MNESTDHASIVSSSKSSLKQRKIILITAAAVAGIVLIAAVVYGITHTSSHKPQASTTQPKVKNTSPSADTDAANTVPSDKPAITNSVVTTHSYASIGQYLADPSGQTLYTYGGDVAGVSHCTGSCLDNWPIYEDAGITTGLPDNIGTIKRTDNGKIQYTYKGMPLYYYAQDQPGQVTDGLDNFHAAKL